MLGSQRARLGPFAGASLLALWGVLLTGCPTTHTKDQGATIRIDAQRFRVDLASDDYAKGGATPLVTIVVFTDFACPPCARTWTVMNHLTEDYGEDLRIVYRSYTVPGFGRGEQAAEAAYAAGAQGKFWDMHERLFQQGGTFDRPTLRLHAQEIGLDVPKFLDDLDTGAFSGRRGRDRRQATLLGITGLPAMFINGLYLAGFVEEATLHGIIDEEIRHVREVLANGVPRAQLYATLMQHASTAAVSTPEAARELKQQLDEATSRRAAPVAITEPRGDARYRIEPPSTGLRGPADAPVVIVAFMDFQCPFCRKAWNTEVSALLASHSHDVGIAVRHLPLEIHVAALGAAKASLAASRQGKFWEFQERLLSFDGPLGRTKFVEWARALGLDESRFLRDLDDPEVAAEVDADVDLATRVGVSGTPGFFVNGRYLGGFTPGALTALVDEELKNAEAMTQAGTPRAQVHARIMDGAIGPEGFPNTPQGATPSTSPH